MLKDFTRVAWVSATAQARWESTLRGLQQAWLARERETVWEGLRPAALQFEAPVSRPGTFSAEVSPGRWVTAVSADVLRDFLDAWGRRDDDTIGHHLGFPACCRAFFARVWPHATDTTRHMGGASGGVVQPTTPYVNILGRWMGVRAVPHLPCDWHCAASDQLARSWVEGLARPHREILEQLLRWPVKYSALHGVAIITTPVFKVVTPTDYTPGEVTLEYHGTVRPEGAAAGLVFPFARTATPVLIPMLRPSLWRDNGFPTFAAMTEAHQWLLPHLQGKSSLIDLGAGNGHLLQQTGAPVTLGIECEATKVARSMGRMLHGRIQDLATLVPTETFECALISQRRLEEMTAAETVAFRTWCRKHLRSLLVYSYDTPRFVHLDPVASLTLVQ